MRRLCSRHKTITANEVDANTWLLEATLSDSYQEMSAVVQVKPDGTIISVVADMVRSPWPDCLQTPKVMSRVVGLRLGPGFAREMREALPEAESCLHMRDLLLEIGRTYYHCIGRQHDEEPDEVRRSVARGYFQGQCYTHR